VTRFCKVLTLTAGLCGLAAAADREMMNLVMPEASRVMEINVAKIMASPIGAAIGEAAHQGIATQLKAELTKAKPQFQTEVAGLSNIDWSREVQDVVIAGGTSQSAPMLIIVRCDCDLARIQSLGIFASGTGEYEGVPVLNSSKPGNGAIAFLPNSIVLIGELAVVQSAIHRRSQPTVLTTALAAQVAQYKDYDIWVAQTGIQPAPSALPATGSNSAGAGSPLGGKLMEYAGKVARFNGGLRLNPDFDFSSDIEARTEKGAAELTEGLHWLTNMVDAQAKRSGKQQNGLEALKYELNGKHILLSLHVPEAQIRAGLRQMHASQAAQTAVAARRAPPEVPRMAPSSGLPPPPPGTIRVQSSEMGTVLLPVGRQ
jgi:hypothetical protein